MKKMNGFELITALKRDYPYIKIIVLSCNDFQNVKEAMRLGANDYIFKLSVTKEELLITLEGLKSQINEEIEKDNNKNIYDVIFKQNISVIKDKKFKIAIDQSYLDEKEFCNEFNNLNMKVNINEKLVILVVKINKIYELNYNGKIQEKDILNSVIGNITSEILQIFQCFEVFNYDEGNIVAIINSKDFQDIQQQINSVFIKIKDYMDRYLGISVSGGIFVGFMKD